MSGNFVVRERMLRANYSPLPPEAQAGIESAIRQSSFAPGVAPWVGARVGIGGNNEAGLTYTGRSVRGDARHVFGDEKWALSLGAGASAVLSHIENGTPQTTIGADPATKDQNVITSSGWGLDVPVLVGYRSTASVAQIWLGARGGIERLNGDFAPLGSSQVTSGLRYELRLDQSVMRYYGGGLLGLAVGFHPIWVALELNVAYQFAAAEGELPGGGRASLDMSGVTIAPAGALIGKF
jgi:hypothetical protein